MVLRSADMRIDATYVIRAALALLRDVASIIATAFPFHLSYH